jgi:hypothetical protein
MPAMFIFDFERTLPARLIFRRYRQCLKDSPYKKIHHMVFGNNADEFIRILGNVMIQFTFIEHTCAMITDAITRSSEGTKCFNKIKNAQQRIVTFGSLTQNIDSEHSGPFQIFLERLENIRERRNFLAHATYGNIFDENDEILTTMNGQIKKYSMTDHRALMSEMNSLTSDILRFSAPITSSYIISKYSIKNEEGS